MIRQIRAQSDCEILVTTGAIAPRSVFEPEFVKHKPAAIALDVMERFPDMMATMCREEKVEFFDTRQAWNDYMLASYQPYEHFARDRIHANGRGKAVLGRMMGRYFSPK